jgi:hypothetical protein
MEFNVGYCPIEYNELSNKPTLMASGLRDLDQGIRYTACRKTPVGDITLGPVNMNYTSGKSFTNMFTSSFNFYDKDRNMVSTKQKMVGNSGIIKNNVDLAGLYLYKYQPRIQQGEAKYINTNPPDRPYFPYWIYKTYLPAEYYRKLLVAEPVDDTDAENVSEYLISLIQPPSESAKVRKNITDTFWRLQD